MDKGNWMFLAVDFKFARAARRWTRVTWAWRCSAQPLTLTQIAYTQLLEPEQFRIPKRLINISDKKKKRKTGDGEHFDALTCQIKNVWFDFIYFPCVSNDIKITKSEINYFIFVFFIGNYELYSNLRVVEIVWHKFTIVALVYAIIKSGIFRAHSRRRPNSGLLGARRVTLFYT